MIIESIKESEIRQTCEMIERACKNSLFAEFYPQCSIDYMSELNDFEAIKRRADHGHFYVIKETGKIIGCGGIDAYLDRTTESRINTVFIAPEYQHKGIGKTLIEFLENDEYAKRANRLEIHAAISAIPFYRKLGYEHKNGTLNYHDGMFDLEKFI